MSVVWSECRCVMNTASIRCGGTPVWNSRSVAPQPVSTRMLTPPPEISCDGPNRCGVCIGLEVPSKVSSIEAITLLLGHGRFSVLSAAATIRSTSVSLGRAATIGWPRLVAPSLIHSP